jgi:methionyl-tRNA formyltransferase
VRIAFFGLPLAAVLLARDGHAIVYAAACRKTSGLRRLRALAGTDSTFLRPDVADAATVARVRAARPDLIVSWFWTTRLPSSLLDVAPAIGVHPSLLPRHRGPDPYFWAIDEGDARTGVTAHLLDANYDTGAVLGRRELAVDPSWNAWKLARALDRPSLALLRETVRRAADTIAAGRPLAGTAQDEALATEAPEPDDDALAIRWSWTAARVERRVRAAAPWPGAWTEIGDQIVTIVRVRATSDFPRALEPAEAGVRRDGVAVVRTPDGAVELLAGRSQDDADLGTADLAAIVRAAAKLPEDAR